MFGSKLSQSAKMLDILNMLEIIKEFNRATQPPKYSYSYVDQRFDLVKIAFTKRLEWGFDSQKDKNAIAKHVVELADSVLAEMEKKPEAENEND